MKSTGLKLMIHRLADCGEGAKGPPPLPFSSHRCSSTKKEGGYSSGFSKSGRFIYHPQGPVEGAGHSEEGWNWGSQRIGADSHQQSGGKGDWASLSRPPSPSLPKALRVPAQSGDGT